MEGPPVGVEGASQAEKETIDRDKLFEFYLAVRSEQVEWMNRYGQNYRQYLVLITAILAATLAAVYQFRDDVAFKLVAASLGMGVNILLCRLAMWACDRSYQLFLESIGIAARLEEFFGLDGPRPTTAERGDSSTRFPRDAQLLPQRWLRGRQHETAAEFVKEKMSRGFNRVARITLILLALMNFLLWVGVILLTLFN